ncbi:Hypothetical predicted protein [Paramuricea clavata]|uniref:Uncharacterized protein n=1 Tax=Paramuricea clavata TaxID=317549 RepID=A0A7D9DZT7_PARCT|nr:Hypothetical predicted protein [Paramuricea clavata]
MQRVTRSNQSSGSINDELRGYFESESFMDIMRRVVSNMVAEESFQLALKKSVDAAVASTVEPFNKKLAEFEQYVPRVTDLEKKINDLESRLSAAQEEAKLAINRANDNEQYSRKYN